MWGALPMPSTRSPCSALVTGIENRETYLNIHTTMFNGGRSAGSLWHLSLAQSLFSARASLLWRTWGGDAAAVNRVGIDGVIPPTGECPRVWTSHDPSPRHRHRLRPQIAVPAPPPCALLALPLPDPRLTLGHGVLSDHGKMPKKVMVIVPRTAPALFAYLKDKFADDRTISVIMDRRISERRQLNETPRTERRQGDRRQAGRDHAIVVSEP